MKTSAIILFVVLSINLQLKAQRIAAEEENENLGGGVNPAVSVIVYETDESTVQKEWKSLMKKNDGKVSESHGASVAKNVLMKDLGRDTLTVYSRADKADEGIKLIVSVSPESEMPGFKRIMEDFARRLTKESIADQQKDAEKELDKEERNLTRLVRDNSDLHNDITKYNDKIKKAEDDIKDNLKKQDDEKKMIDAKRKVLDAKIGRASCRERVYVLV